jgi:hypothetical protein
MSTLDQADVDVMKATKTCVAAQKFQYDYLNDDITDDGQIDYSLTNKVPEGLKKAIADGKKILILINPPYAESGEGFSKGNKNKVAKTKFAATAMQEYGKASNELFTQFVARISKEIPNATLAMFSTLKYVNAPNFEKFRQHWNAKYLDGFIVHSKAFEGLKGNFPIGFLIWKIQQSNPVKQVIDIVTTEVLDKNANPIGEKNFYNLPNSTYLNKWIKRPKANNSEVIPLKNTISPAILRKHVGKWSDNAIAHLLCDGNDLQNAVQTALFSSTHGIGHKGALFVNPENLWQSTVVFSVRRLIKPTWINDRDQFLQPNTELSEEFKNDCLIYMLFHGSNLTASANDLEWNDQKWSIVNHFIPFTEQELNSPDRFESDFMVQYLTDKKLSSEAQAVLEEGKKLWQAYFEHTDPHSVREELKLNRPDVGWYQIRKALEARNSSGDFAPVSFDSFKSAYNTLSDKLRPQVFEYGFLKS